MYGKIFRQIYHGTLATTGPWQAIVTFQQLIVLSDAEGVVDMTLDSISRETTIPREILEIGMQALEQPDAESRSPEEDGRRVVKLSDSRKWGWRIVNFLHYRKLRSEEDRREYHKQYWKTKRSPKITDSTLTQQYSTILNTTQPTQPTQPMQDAGCNMQYAEAHTDSDSDSEARVCEADQHKGFESVKTAYPKFAGRKDWIQAEMYCRNRIDDGETWLTLKSAVERFAAYCRAIGREGTNFVMSPSKFFSAADQPWKQAWELPEAKGGKSISEMIDEACDRE